MLGEAHRLCKALQHKRKVGAQKPPRVRELQRNNRRWKANENQHLFCVGKKRVGGTAQAKDIVTTASRKSVIRLAGGKLTRITRLRTPDAPAKPKGQGSHMTQVTNQTPAQTGEAAKAAWLEQRRNYITGTDIGAIMGYSKWASPMSIWCEKKGIAEPQPQTNAQKRGLQMERTILEMYSEETGNALIYPEPYTLLTTKDGIIAATLDATHSNGDNPVDAKNKRICDPKEWGESNSDKIPKQYHLQLVAQMIVTNSSMASLAVLFSGQDFRHYKIERDYDLEQMVVKYCNDWWQKHIIDGVQPEIDGSDASTSYIKQKLERAQKGLVIETTPEIFELCERLKEIKAKAAEIESEKKAAENNLKMLIGDAEEVSGVLTWKNNKDGVNIDWETVARSLAVQVYLDNADKMLMPHISNNTTTKPGARVLRLK